MPSTDHCLSSQQFSSTIALAMVPWSYKFLPCTHTYTMVLLTVYILFAAKFMTCVFSSNANAKLHSFSTFYCHFFFFTTTRRKECHFFWPLAIGCRQSIFWSSSCHLEIDIFLLRSNLISLSCLCFSLKFKHSQVISSMLKLCHPIFKQVMLLKSSHFFEICILKSDWYLNQNVASSFKYYIRAIGGCK